MNIFKRKPKTTDSMQNMMAKLKVFADEQKQNFYHVSVKLYHYSPTQEGFEVTAYVHTFTHMTGRTIEECIQKLKDYKKIPEPSPLVDVTF